MKIAHTLFDPSSRWYYPLRWAAIICLGLVIYGQVFGYGFVFDDLDFIVNNPYIKKFDHVQYVWRIFPKTRTIGFYSFAFNYYIDQLHPQSYHIFNFVIHLIAVGFVWALADMVFKITGCASRELSFIVALLFLVHPCQTQAVTYISQRFESMATVFYIASIYFYMCGRIASSAAHKILSFLCSMGFAILGLFTKETAVTIPWMILAAELIFFRKKISFRGFCIFLVLAGIFFSLFFLKLVKTDLNIFFHFLPIPSESHDGDMITASNYLLTQMRVFLTFIRLMVLPVHQNPDYDYSVSKGLLDPPLTMMGLCLIGGMVLSILKLRKKFPAIAFGLAWVLITFSINLAPRANVIFEHKLYLISFGLFLVLVNVLFIIIRRKSLFAGFLIVMIAALTLLSFLRNQVWENQLSLWGDVVKKSPHKARPYINRGLAYFYQGNLTQALVDYNKAIKISPDNAEAFIDRGLVFYNQGHLIQAILDYNKAIEINPENAKAFNNRAIVYYGQGNLMQAMADYNRALEKNPNYAEAYYNRGNIYDVSGNLSLALSDFNKSIEINPDNTGVYYNRGLLYAKLGDLSRAISDFTKAIQINPNNAEIYINRGVAFSQQSDFTQAISDYDKAININPHNADAFYKRGICYAHLGNFTQAISDDDKAIALNPNYAQVYYNRADLYYHLKEYDKARKDVFKGESLGVKINPEFLKDLKNK